MKEAVEIVKLWKIETIFEVSRLLKQEFKTEKTETKQIDYIYMIGASAGKDSEVKINQKLTCKMSFSALDYLHQLTLTVNSAMKKGCVKFILYVDRDVDYTVCARELMDLLNGAKFKGSIEFITELKHSGKIMD